MTMPTACRPPFRRSGRTCGDRLNINITRANQIEPDVTIALRFKFNNNAKLLNVWGFMAKRLIISR